MIDYISVDRILSMIHREVSEEAFHEEDILEWIGEAMSFLKVSPVFEQAVKIVEVVDHKADLPNNLAYILQIAKMTNERVVTQFITKEVTPKVDKCGNPIEATCYNSIEDLFNIDYKTWSCSSTRVNGFTPVRLTTNTFFNSIVCKEQNYEELYSNSQDEYTIIGSTHRELLFSFKEGVVAISYMKLLTDPQTGYPLIPDQADFIAAITYYIKWKISESMVWKGREGYSNMLQYARSEWLRYCRQAKNWAMMPKGIDEWVNLMESHFSYIPDYNKYHRGFKSVGNGTYRSKIR